MRVGLLHTADVHVPVFESLISELGDNVVVHHAVDASLLEDATTTGLNDDIRRRTTDRLASLANMGCMAIACTCSTLGTIAEGMDVGGIVVQRIDRAAADELMRFDRVLVLAAIESAGQSADALLEESARRLHSTTNWLVVLVPGAWQHFLDGDEIGYRRMVADFANQFEGYDAVFLSQASMLGAELMCRHDNVVTTPGAGVRRLCGTNPSS